MTGARTLRTLSASARLGARLSPVFAAPWLLLVYIVIKPVSAALILVLMFRAVRGGAAVSSDQLAYIVVGSALWSVVNQTVLNFANSVADDRGRYRTLRYIYIAVPRFAFYVIGRATAEVMTAMVAVLVVLVVATPLLDLPLTLAAIDWPLLLLAGACAAVAVTALAAALSVGLLSLRDSYGYGDIIASSLYLISGAVFPLRVLPGWLAGVAVVSPLTYWLELSRRALLGAHAESAFAVPPPTATVALRLALTTLATVLLAGAVLTLSDRRARRLGLLDRETNA